MVSDRGDLPWAGELIQPVESRAACDCIHVVLLSVAFDHVTSMHGGETVFLKTRTTFRGSKKMGRALLSCTILSRATVLQLALLLPSKKHSRGA